MAWDCSIKTTRAEVERRFGKPNKLGHYVFKEERVSLEYGNGPCRGVYLPLGEDNCKCLADETAVMSIFVEPIGKLTISSLKLDIKKFTRTPINPFPHTFEYSNRAEGVTYTVDEPADEVTTITYYPSPADCKDIINKQAPAYRNAWRGLRPLHSVRINVDTLLGVPERQSDTSATYETDYETVVAEYSDGRCGSSIPDWNVPKNTLTHFAVNPTPSFILQELNLDLARFSKQEIFPYPEIENPPRVWHYIDNLNGVIIRTQSSRGGGDGDEVVVTITYQPTARDNSLMCPKTGNANLRKSGRPDQRY